jgi:hypothetical protein
MLRLFRDAHYEEIIAGLVAVLNIMYVEPYENQDSQRNYLPSDFWHQVSVERRLDRA